MLSLVCSTSVHIVGTSSTRANGTHIIIMYVVRVYASTWPGALTKKPGRCGFLKYAPQIRSYAECKHIILYTIKFASRLVPVEPKALIRTYSHAKRIKQMFHLRCVSSVSSVLGAMLRRRAGRVAATRRHTNKTCRARVRTLRSLPSTSGGAEQIVTLCAFIIKTGTARQGVLC